MRLLTIVCIALLAFPAFIWAEGEPPPIPATEPTLPVIPQLPAVEVVVDDPRRSAKWTLAVHARQPNAPIRVSLVRKVDDQKYHLGVLLPARLSDEHAAACAALLCDSLGMADAVCGQEFSGQDRLYFPGDYDEGPEPQAVSAVQWPVANIVNIARTCHEANRAYCQAMGDSSQLPWSEAPEWQRDSAMKGVVFHLNNPDAGPEASHNAWLEVKRAEGWTYGPVKDPAKKQHPCFVPYTELPKEQQAKDYIFRSIVHSMAPQQEIGIAQVNGPLGALSAAPEVPESTHIMPQGMNIQRTIRTHAVVNDCNSNLDVIAIGPANAGGAPVYYMITLPGKNGQWRGGAQIVLPFQNGDPAVEANGITSEALIAVLIDRLEGFQSGPWHCDENQAALNLLKQTMGWLHERAKAHD